MDPNASTVNWEIAPPDWVVLRALVYGRFALFYGFFLFVLGAAVALVTDAIDGSTGAVTVVVTSAITVALVTALVYAVDEPTRELIGRYLTIAGSQSGSVFVHWQPWVLAAVALGGSICQALLWTTELVPLVVLVGVPVTVRLLEGLVVATVPLAGSIDRSTGTYVRRTSGPLGTTDRLEFDLADRTLSREWSIGEVTVRWYTGEGPPLLVPVPDEYRIGRDAGDRRSSDHSPEKL